jgi:hypothetical protein
MDWGRKPLPRQEDEYHKEFIILDTIITTGDMIKRLHGNLSETPGCPPRSAMVMTCYTAPPVPLRRLAVHPVVKYMVVAKGSQTYDAKGYLVPYTTETLATRYTVLEVQTTPRK